MPIVQAGRQFTADDLKRTAGQLAALLTQAVEDGQAYRLQLESWPDGDLITLGLQQEEINAIKGFYIGDLPGIAATLAASAWIKQLLGTGGLMLSSAINRAWCERIALRLQRESIRRDAAPYLDRYFVAGWSPRQRRAGPAIFLHHFVASDARDQVHSHPWAAISLLLVGAYREHRCFADGTETVRDLQAGDVNVLAPDDRHRIELLTADVWSLFLVSDYVQPWSFAPSC